MKITSGIFLLLICIAVILVVGCTNTTTSSVTPTPRVVYVTVLVTPTPTIGVNTAAPVKQSSGQFPSTRSNEKRQVTIYSVQKTSTYNYLGTSNRFSQVTEPGKIYIMIDAEIKYLGVYGVDSIYTGASGFSVSDVEGTRYDPEPYIANDALGSLKELSKNQKTRGKVVFEVPTTARGLILYYDYGNLVPWGEKSATWEIN